MSRTREVLCLQGVLLTAEELWLQTVLLDGLADASDYGVRIVKEQCRTMYHLATIVNTFHILDFRTN